ncbi:MAG: histone deacetylase [Desulfobacteraceae bacterium]|nr:histone deacetylase [Desulfobacteraceae bacterium]
MKNNTGIVRDKRYMDHVTGPNHPEHPRRLEAVCKMLDRSDMLGCFTEISPREAEKKELILIHSPEYLDKISATEGKAQTSLTPDTHTSPGSYKAALLSAGGLFLAISKVVSGELRNAFALVRPPGHHAEKSRAMGFCLFNNIALGAVYAREFLGLKRILIVDWDVHHGNGTQHSFENDPSVLFISAHQHPLFPGTGLFTEAGIGKGEGFTVNIPLSKGYADAEYAAIFEKLFRPVAMEFGPELILVSAGFDTHKSDPVGGMKMTSAGFAVLTRSLMGIADDCCGGKLVLSLEGGYNVKALAESVKFVLRELSDITIARVQETAARARPRKLNYALHRSMHVHRQFWKSL